jgi:hypothetical protein
VREGAAAGALDARLEAYRLNCARVPSLTGEVIPEAVYTRAAYEREILGRLYRDIAPHDPEGILRFEWLNARGAIARFDRNAVEIRLLDTQEAPWADLAVAAVVSGAVRLLCEERWSAWAAQRAWPVEPLAALLRRCIVDGERTVIEDRGYLAAFGFPGERADAAGLWRHLASAVEGAWPEVWWREPVATILDRGPLARRILRALGGDFRRERLVEVYRRLCDCLDGNRLFLA